jgi:hypothetical protein
MSDCNIKSTGRKEHEISAFVKLGLLRYKFYLIIKMEIECATQLNIKET